MKPTKSQLLMSPFRIMVLFDIGSLLLWKFFSQLIVIPSIESGYKGTGLDFLNHFFASRSARRPFSYYLSLWHDFENAITLALLAHLLVLMIIKSTPFQARLKWLFSLIAGIFLLMTVVWGPRQDYVAHLEIWNEVQYGNDPWWIQPESGLVLNAYGPLFNILAVPCAVNPLAPKLLFSFAYLVFAVSSVKMIQAESQLKSIPDWAILLWFFNPAIWLEVAFYGHFDVLVGLFCLISLVYLKRKRNVLSGLFIGLGFLLKLLPVFVIPFLVINGRDFRKWRWSLCISSVATIVLGLAISMITWGPSTFRPMTYASSRGSNLLSIWRYLKGAHSPLLWFYESNVNLDRFALPCILVFLLILTGLAIKLKSKESLVAFCALLTVLTFYTVGFVQYQIVLFVMVPICIVEHGRLILSRPFLVFSGLIYFLWVGSFDLFDNFVGGIVGFDRKYNWVEDWAGLPMFLVGIFFWIMIMKLLHETTVREIEKST
jgi:hypothetical protein